MMIELCENLVFSVLENIIIKQHVVKTSTIVVRKKSRFQKKLLSRTTTIHNYLRSYLKMRGVQRPRKAPPTKAKVGAKGQPSLQDFIQARDYTGAMALLEFKLKCQDGNMKDLLMWIGYAAFHLGNYKRAEDAYKELLDNHDVPLEVHLFLGCCYFYQQMYEEGEAEALKGPPNSLQNRLLFNICHRKGDEDKLMAYHQNLRDTKEDQLSLAGVHYLRSHHQEATDIYKRQLLENREDLALNVYVAMCYYKLDYYDVSLEILAAYLQAQPDSATAVNLKACNHFRLYNGKAAEAELKVNFAVPVTAILFHTFVLSVSVLFMCRCLPTEE
jgi:intraflagellar transport protein 56